MPGLDGIETVRRARTIAPDLGILYITGYTDPAGAGAEHRIGDDPLIKKPFKLRTLRQAVRLAIKRAPRRAGATLARPGGADPRASPPRAL